MKKNFKLLGLVTIAVSVLTLFAGCTNFAKQNAMVEYTSSLKDDVVYWEAAQLTLNQMVSASDAKSYASYINTMSGYLDSIVSNAENRNASISDPELKDIDDNYVSFTKDLQSCYSLMYEAINEQDDSKMSLSEMKASSSIESMKLYISGIKDFTDKYEIRLNEDFNTVTAQLEMME